MSLDFSVGKLAFVGSHYKHRLEKMGIYTIRDLIGHAPSRYLDYKSPSQISKCKPDEVVSIQGEIVSILNQYTQTGRKVQIGSVRDSTGAITVVFFNQPYLIRILYPGVKVAFAGKVSFFGRKLALISPEYELIREGKKLMHTQGLIPIYPETKGVTSKWLRVRIKNALEIYLDGVEEYLPEKIILDNNFLEISKAYKLLHSPQSLKQAQNARKRLAFDELFLLQINNYQKKTDWRRKNATYPLTINKKEVDSFTSSLPFMLTKSQEKSINEVLEDLKKDYPMNRLLEGDVGSGKTVVSAIGAFISFLNGYQSIFMAPTQILAQQHFNTLEKLFKKYKIRITLITSTSKKQSLGRTDIYVGTHALIHKKISFDKISYVVIDEQHKFGVEQRAHLIKKSGKRKLSPHFLTMTATPIPRTVALTLYGDLDLSTLTELPAGRQKTTTWVVAKAKRDRAYSWIEKQIIKDHIQAFVVCPLIEESEVETMQTVKAATAEFARLKKILSELNLGLLHGRQKVEEKSRVLENFRKGKIDVLVSTPVVEVGIDIPNATIMVVEAAERFGLASLHQLRGRVGRGSVKSYCLLMTDDTSQNASPRLSAMQKSYTGFQLAEVDLRLRGPGEIFGVRQHGFKELKIASWQDTELIKLSKKVAQEIMENQNNYNKTIDYLKKLQVTSS